MAFTGIVLIASAYVVSWGFLWPGDAVLHGLAAEGAHVYSRGSFGSVLGFHWRETGRLILPLLAMTLPKTLGLMALGAAVWQAGVLRDPQKYRSLLWEASWAEQ